MKTIGTLEEIGAQVGDVVRCLSWTGEVYKVGHVLTVDRTVPEHCGEWIIVARAAKSPVRTVTREYKVIDHGIYGKVSVHQLRPDNGGYYIAMVDSLTHKESTVHSAMTTSDLTAAIATLTEIRDAMAGDE